MDELIILLTEYRDVIGKEDLRLFLSSVKMIKQATGGWGTISLEFKGGDAKQASILLTQRATKDGLESNQK